jgi:anti-sigma B factor antagonist
MFNATTRPDGVIAFVGRLDAAQTEQANAFLQQITSSVTLDLKELDYISSAGLGILLANQKRLKSQGNGLKLINLNKFIGDIFMYTGFDKLFEIG